MWKKQLTLAIKGEQYMWVSDYPVLKKPEHSAIPWNFAYSSFYSIVFLPSKRLASH